MNIFLVEIEVKNSMKFSLVEDKEQAGQLAIPSNHSWRNFPICMKRLT